MLTRALKYKDAFDRMEAENKLYNEFFLERDKDGNLRIGPATTKDWEAINRLVQFLNIFYLSTLVVFASSALNSHKCYGEISTIEKNLIRLGKSRDTNLRTMAKKVREKFDKYWDGLKEINRLLIVASVFDPAKKMQFADLCFDQVYGKDNVVSKKLKASVLDVMKRLFVQYISFSRSATSSHTPETGTSSSHAIQRRSGKEIITEDEFQFDDDEIQGYERMDYVYKEMVNEKGIHDASNELELYLKESVKNPNVMKGTDYDVLGWWRLNTPKFPILSEVARDVLAMQVSSVASESAFSTSGRILDPYRSCLTHTTLEVLMCTEQWLKCEIHMDAKGVITNSDLLAEIEYQDKLQKEFGL